MQSDFNEQPLGSALVPPYCPPRFPITHSKETEIPLEPMKLPPEISVVHAQFADGKFIQSLSRLRRKISWLLRGTRMPVSVIFENLKAGANIDNIKEWFQGLDPRLRPLSNLLPAISTRLLRLLLAADVGSL